MKSALKVIALSCFVGGMTCESVFARHTIEIVSGRDNSLFETAKDQPGEQFEDSNGAGYYLFSGRTGEDAGFKRRRALIWFDLAANIPDDAKIIKARLTLYQSKAAPGSPATLYELSRVLQAWGEGESDAVGPEGQGAPALPGDATWHHRIWPDQEWTLAGGDFSATASASAVVSGPNGFYEWSCTPEMLADLNAWLSTPADNHGWAVLGGEDDSFNAHRFNSREHPTTDQRPRLSVTWVSGDVVFEDGFEQIPICN